MPLLLVFSQRDSRIKTGHNGHLNGGAVREGGIGVVEDEVDEVC